MAPRPFLHRIKRAIYDSPIKVPPALDFSPQPPSSIDSETSSPSSPRRDLWSFRKKFQGGVTKLVRHSKLPPVGKFGLESLRKLSLKTTGTETAATLLRKQQQQQHQQAYQHDDSKDPATTEPVPREKSQSICSAGADSLSSVLTHVDPNRNNDHVELQEQNDLIRDVLENKRFLHPAFKIAYRSLHHCIDRRPTSFTCLFEHAFTHDTVLVKFIFKSKIDPANTALIDGYVVPLKLITYRGNQKVGLPLFLQDFEDEDMIYVVFAVRGIPKENPSIFESDCHKFDWDELYKD